MIDGPGRPSLYDPPRLPSIEWANRYTGVMGDRDILPHLIGRHRDQRIRVGSFDDEDPSTWTTSSRRGVSLRIPPHALTGSTITLDAYRRWETETTTTRKAAPDDRHPPRPR